MNEQTSSMMELNKSNLRASTTDDHVGAALRAARTHETPDYIMQLNIRMTRQLCGHLGYHYSG
jgi:hypothetical protein